MQVEEARDLLHRALDAYAGSGDTEALDRLEHELDRLDAPLRVALAGKLKAGKSTLLNALLGDELAATDHAECTRVVTWYRHGSVPSITVHPVTGEPWTCPPRRGPAGLVVDLRGCRAEEVDRVEVVWPASGLRDLTLVDTPGLDSLSREVSHRTSGFLTAEEESPVDAVVYLMRHLHATDVRFLEAFEEARSRRDVAAATVAVLSRADEVGVGRIDAMISADRVAERYRAHAALRAVCQTVVPVSGLLAHTGQTLREDEVAALRVLAAMDRAEVEGLLLSVDRFRQPSLSLGVPAEMRAHLLSRLGLFGVRMALAVLRLRRQTAATLADELVRRSGLPELRRVLTAQLMERRDQLRAQAAVRAVARLVADAPPPDGVELAARCEQLVAGAHELREIALLARLRATPVELSPEQVASADRLLGGDGRAVVARLRLPADARPADVRTAAAHALEQWRALADDPMLDTDTRRVCRVLVRTCEGLLTDDVRPVREHV
ncbi:dynamin family protein [Cellulomonas fimi]|uniref:GTP-binding protein n=1 Tax=Cellulomonas fimi TaxID=1708 RepID=A0A7Y0QI40_CELFI|nr:dynamin family protein [Cellulomonas fimi]NMR20793.1 GTP-binding protein [Cellulomonas fimi]